MDRPYIARLKGFTIVELLVAIVVIAILATISFVAYNGIQHKAHDAAVKSDLSSFYKHAKVEGIFDNSAAFAGNYPFSIITPNDISHDCHSDLFNNYGEFWADPNLKSCKLLESGQQKIKALLGASPNRNSYWKNGTDDIYSLVLSVDWQYRTVHYQDGGVGWDVQTVPVLTGRSQSGKSFVHSGSLRDNIDDASYVEYIENEIEYYEESIPQYNACASGATCIYDWWSAEDTQWWNSDDYGRAWSEEELARLRRELDWAKGNKSLASMMWEYPKIFYSAANDGWYIGGEGYWADSNWQGRIPD